MAWSTPAWATGPFTLDVRSLACFRVAVGAVVLADAVLRTRDVPLMLAPDGMFPLAALREFFGDRWTWSLAFLVDATWWGAAVLAIQAVAGIALAVGAGTRLATVAAWVAVVSLVRRTAPAANAGDEWLCCLLFWGMFLPLGAAWSVDARRRGRATPFPTICSPATVALVLQIAAVYLSAGAAKWNRAWLSGDAVATALSLHDHGSAWGEAVAGHPAVCRLLTWGVLALELVGPCLLVATRRPVVRLSLVVLFMGFHAATAVLMSLGLFAYVGLAAWLAIVPTEAWAWGRGTSAGDAPVDEARAKRPWETAAVTTALGVAAVSFVHDNTAWRPDPLPAAFHVAVRVTCLGQDWGMFGDVPPQRQWVYGCGTTADGSVVDVLRNGRPLEETLPAGGYTSLPNHRWHKLFWALPTPARRGFSAPVAAALAADWNRRHAPPRQLVALEIRAVRTGLLPGTEPGTVTRHELLIASWPPRDGAGRGNLDRRLDELGPP
ncbi:MAG: HTTM domain-containing protein [Planctomycetia bacterium]